MRRAGISRSCSRSSAARAASRCEVPASAADRGLVRGRIRHPDARPDLPHPAGCRSKASAPRPADGRTRPRRSSRDPRSRGRSQEEVCECRVLRRLLGINYTPRRKHRGRETATCLPSERNVEIPQADVQVDARHTAGRPWPGTMRSRRRARSCPCATLPGVSSKPVAPLFLPQCRILTLYYKSNQ